MVFSGAEIVAEFVQLGISHVIWVPDSDLGKWEAELESSPIVLLRVCREGETWPLAAGLIVGGESPIVVIQTTGLFESGDALRNVVYDLNVPVFAIVGARSWLNASSQDSSKRFCEPVMKAWDFDYVIVESGEDQIKLKQHYQHCRAANKPGFILLAE